MRSQTAISGNNPRSQTITSKAISSTWSGLAEHFSNFCPSFQIRANQRKPKYASLTNHVACLLSSEPADSFPVPVASNQGTAEGFSLSLFFLLYIFSTPLPEFESVPNTSNSGWLSCYSKLWINILCLFLFGWPWSISSDAVEVPLKTSIGNCPSPQTLAFARHSIHKGPLVPCCLQVV